MGNDLHLALESAAYSAMMAFGPVPQMVKTCEEAGELIVALAKRINGSPVENAAIIDEVADVIIMAYQMRLSFGMHEVDARIKFKLNRTLEFIRNQKDKENV